MTVPKRGPRLLGLFVFLGCIALSVGGLWYLKTGGWSDGQDTDDDEGASEVTPEGVGYRRGPKQKTSSSRSKKKPTESRQARIGSSPHPGAAILPGGATPPTG